ncbi:MAG: hypothetical protein GX451_08360 [Acholeplasmataceae bacterium]|nr:hypothetical protein [Acholeplasmataceae bacterium]
MLPSNIPTNIICAILSIWFILFLLGREQTKHIKTKTKNIALENIEKSLQKNEDLTIDEYYEQINKQWEQMVHNTAKFILHRNELLPLPAKPEIVRRQINFSPEWLGAYLTLNGYVLIAKPEQQKRIDFILSLIKHDQQTKEEERRAKNS